MDREEMLLWQNEFEWASCWPEAVPPAINSALAAPILTLSPGDFITLPALGIPQQGGFITRSVNTITVRPDDGADFQIAVNRSGSAIRFSPES